MPENDPTISLEEYRQMIGLPQTEVRSADNLDKQNMTAARRSAPTDSGPPSWPAGRSGIEDMMERKHPILHRMNEGIVSTGAMALGAGAAAPAAAARGLPRVANVLRGLAANPGANTVYGGGAGAAAGGVKEATGSEAAAIATEMLAPMGLQKLGKGAYEAALGSITKEVEELLPKARGMGFEIKPAQARTRKPEETAGPLHNQEVANREATRVVDGIGSTELGDKWAQNIHKMLGARFDQIYSKTNTFEIPTEQARDLSGMISATELDAVPGIAPIRKALEKLIGGTGPDAPIVLNGEQLKNVRGALVKATQGAAQGGGNGRWIAGEAIDLIDSGVRATDPAIAAQLSELRPKYRALMTLDEVRKAGGVDAKGNLSPKALGDYLRTHDNRYRRGESTNPLAELGKIGETFGIKGSFEKEPEKTVGGMAKKLAPYAKGAALAAGGHYVLGMDPFTAAAVGGAATMLGKKGLSGKTAQQVQTGAAKYMREQPAPVAAEAGGALVGGSDAPEEKE